MSPTHNRRNQCTAPNSIEPEVPRKWMSAGSSWPALPRGARTESRRRRNIENIARIFPSASTEFTAQAQKSAGLRLPAIVGSL